MARLHISRSPEGGENALLGVEKIAVWVCVVPGGFVGIFGDSGRASVGGARRFFKKTTKIIVFCLDSGVPAVYISTESETGETRSPRIFYGKNTTKIIVYKEASP